MSGEIGLITNYMQYADWRLIVLIICITIAYLGNRFIKASIIKKNGYPPSHTDVYGNQYEKDE